MEWLGDTDMLRRRCQQLAQVRASVAMRMGERYGTL